MSRLIMEVSRNMETETYGVYRQEMSDELREICGPC